MLVELKAKSQVTIPKDIVNSMELNQGDQFEITEDNVKIVLVPVAIYPEHVIDDLKNSVEDIKESIKKGEQLLFDSIDFFRRGEKIMTCSTKPKDTTTLLLQKY